MKLVMFMSLTSFACELFLIKVVSKPICIEPFSLDQCIFIVFETQGQKRLPFLTGMKHQS